MTGEPRRDFLDQRREICRRRYDELHAAVYDKRWGAYCNPTHLNYVSELIDATAPGAELLDAGCGTGKYWLHLLDRDRKVFGVDQSGEMLARAYAKTPEVPARAVALQDLRGITDFCNRFNGLLCVEVMENIGPEDWPIVLDGFRSVLRKASPVYLTVELPEEPFTGSMSSGLAPGEVIEEGAYHHYPSREAVTGWLDDAGFRVRTERTGDGYWHLLATKI